MKPLNFGAMPSTSRPLLALLLALAAIPSCYAQGKTQLKTSPAPATQSVPGGSSACDLLTQADAESVIGLSLNLVRGPDQSVCTFLGTRPGLVAARRTEVRLDMLNTAAPNPDAVRAARARLVGVPAAIKDVPDVADAALWFWTNDDGGTGRLIVFKSGTTELIFTIVGVSEDAALAGAKKLAARALGGAGGTGYAYRAAAPEETCNPADPPAHNISGCLKAVRALHESGLMGDSGHPAQTDLGGPGMLVRLEQARAKFWATYPDGNGHPDAVCNLRKALSVVDFSYLYFHFYSLSPGVPSDGAGQLRQNLFQGIAGVPPEETVIHKSALKQFDAWKLVVYNRLNGGFSDILNIQARLPQALNETETQYQRYIAARDDAEFSASEQRLTSEQKLKKPATECSTAQASPRTAPRGPAENRPGIALSGRSPAAYSSQWMGQNVVIVGTVSRVEVLAGNRFPKWVTIYFKESPDAAFVVCTPYPDLLQERAGPDLSALVGRTLQVAGPVEGPMCPHKVSKGSIRLLVSKQWQLH